MWKKIGLGLAALIAVLLVVIMTRPSTYKVERSTMISAAPERVFAHVVDFKKWDAWSPWAKLDPNMKVTYTGTAGTVGSAYEWVANDQVGTGKMTIVGIDPNKRIDIKLEFIKPFESVASDSFTFEPVGNETKVTWSMSGENSFVGKAMSLIGSIEDFIAKDFEKGLAEMKKVVESAPARAEAGK